MDHKFQFDFNGVINIPQEKSSSPGVPPETGKQYEALLAYRRESSCYVQAKTRQPEYLDLVRRDERLPGLQMLMSPIKGETRKLYVFDREMILLDKAGAGGVPIQEVDDATAAHYFLEWLHGQREVAELRKSNKTRHRTGASLKGGVL